MKHLQVSLILTLLILTSCLQRNIRESPQGGIAPKEVSRLTADSVRIFGYLYEISKSTPTVILFHQAGSNARAEYRSIIPVLVKKGFNVLAIDQRQGGQVFGNYNKTVAGIPNNEFSFCDASKDLEAALNFILKSGFTGKKILWGSSYSGLLAINLAHERQSEIHGVLAFSPASGGPIEDCKFDNFFETLRVPLLLLRPAQEMELESVKAQFNLAMQHNHQTYIAINGAHGSSMLVEERVGKSVADNWEIVTSFLTSIKNK
ncbi:MAG: alpha/beta fold hydrolase [Saprospiraceae bacterium]